MIRVKGYGRSRDLFMGEGYVETDHDADDIRVTTVANGDSGGQLLELLSSASQKVVAAYAPGRWVSAYVTEGTSQVEQPARTVAFSKED
jgi:hypothetical protein